MTLITQQDAKAYVEQTLRSWGYNRVMIVEVRVPNDYLDIGTGTIDSADMLDVYFRVENSSDGIIGEFFPTHIFSVWYDEANQKIYGEW